MEQINEQQLTALELSTGTDYLKSGAASLEIHPLRDELYNELHSRPFHLLNSPAQITHIAVQHGGKFRDEEHQFLSQLCDRYQTSAPARTMPCYHQNFGLFSLRWERHLEFSSYTFIHEGPLTGVPFAKNAIEYVPKDWLNSIPGKVVVALHMVVEPSDGDEEPGVSVVRDYFDNLRLIGSRPHNGGAKVWTAFRLHNDGFGRMLIYNRGMTTAQLGRLVQRLLELETYRLMATLGVPMARQINGQLNGLESELKELTQQIANADEGYSDRELLSKMSQMAARSEAFRSQSNYRFAASLAYYDVVLHRLDVIKEDEITGHLTLREFLSRRLQPAVRTCQTVSTRLDDISRRITRASDLLRTRVETAVQEQNQQLLSSMDRRANLQLRLQQTVEGLSVAAISYYSIGLIKYLMDSIYGLGVSFNKDLVLGGAVPVVIFSVFMGTRFIHKRLIKDADH
ncbi:MAG: DUF3422 domain-containing protein [Motiliproteus sp.]|nr:DUF3422 domain-containing protein [Motiliproteus sp.]MCW9053887.1 DUF3422 domain-containing protein [Motiliproteus sp.]